MDIKTRWLTTTCALFFVLLSMALTADTANPGVQMRVTKKGDISWKFTIFVESYILFLKSQTRDYQILWSEFTNLLNIPYSYQFSSGQIFTHVCTVIWSLNFVPHKNSVFKF